MSLALFIEVAVILLISWKDSSCPLCFSCQGAVIFTNDISDDNSGGLFQLERSFKSMWHFSVGNFFWPWKRKNLKMYLEQILCCFFRIPLSAAGWYYQEWRPRSATCIVQCQGLSLLHLLAEHTSWRPWVELTSCRHCCDLRQWLEPTSGLLLFQ